MSLIQGTNSRGDEKLGKSELCSGSLIEFRVGLLLETTGRGCNLARVEDVLLPFLLTG